MNEKNKEQSDCKQGFIDIHATDEYGTTALGTAAYRGDLDLITLLLRHGAHPKVKDEGSLLVSLAFAESLDALKLLVKHGADVNTPRSPGGQTVLMVAASRGNVDMFSYLLDIGADPSVCDGDNRSVLCHAIEGGNREIIDQLIALDQSESSKSDTYLLDERAMNPLCGQLPLDVIKRLIEYGFDINMQDKRGFTALFYAVFSRRNCDDIRWLLQAGADPNVQASDGTTVLMIVARHGRTDVVSLLLEFGANQGIKDEDGFTPLHMAVLAGPSSQEVVELLINHGGDVHTRNNDGDTILMGAVCNSKTVSMLLSQGVDPNIQNRYGESALLRSVEFNFFDTVKLLLDHGANVQLRGSMGETPLICAVREGNIKIVKVLLEYVAKSVVE